MLSFSILHVISYIITVSAADLIPFPDLLLIASYDEALPSIDGVVVGGTCLSSLCLDFKTQHRNATTIAYLSPPS